MTPNPIQLRARPKALRFPSPAMENAKFEIHAEAENPTITIFDVIGVEVTSSRIAAALRQIGARPVTVQINSPGGDYYEGITIYNLLRGHSKPVTVQVLGIAASAASVIAMAGERIEMARNAEIMVHRAETIAIGNHRLMADAAAYLEEIDTAMAETYAARTELPIDRIKALLDAETFMPSHQAIAFGFADALLDRDADPKPRTTKDQAPQSKRELETTLRQLGFSKTQANRVAAGGMPALTGNDVDGLDLEPIAAAIKTFTAKIQERTIR